VSARLTPEEGAALLALARAAIEDRLFDNGALRAARDAMRVTPALGAELACFVTIKIPGRGGALELRGCIGTTEARLPAADAVVESALDAAFADPRFPPLSGGEHGGLVISVSALTPMAPVPDAEAIVVGRDGVALEWDDRSALFLPEVAAEQRWTAAELLEELARKAGLPRGAWRRARIKTFQSERFEEKPGEAARIPRS
jgi:AmmeMemoRadiSam system protein A